MFWELEKLGVENTVVEHFKSNIHFDNKKCQYTVKLPFKQNHPLFSHNYSLCIKRLNTVLKRLKNDSELLKECNKIIIDQLKSGVIEKVNNYDLNIGGVHFLPHRPICRKDKVKVVPG